MVNIDVKYRTPLKGKYTAGVYVCPHCDNNMLKTRYDNIVGFSSSKIGDVAITQCNKCFEYFYCHVYQYDYDIFLDCISLGRSVFFKEQTNDDQQHHG